MIGEGKKEYLPIIFKTVPEADGAYALGIHGLFANELQDSPKTFLLYLSKESVGIRKEVYQLISRTEEVETRETFEKINASVEKLKDDEELKFIAAEFLREVNKRRRTLRLSAISGGRDFQSKLELATAFF